MPSAVLSRITYANVVSTLALFIALGGGAYALTGVPDSDGVIHGCVSKKTGVLRVVANPTNCHKAKRHGKHRDPGELAISWNQQGPRGLTGAQGQPGAAGTAGAAGRTNVVVRTAAGSAATNAASVECHPGERATGGGGDGINNTDPLVASWATSNAATAADGQTPTGWEVISTQTGVHHVWVVCVSP